MVKTKNFFKGPCIFITAALLLTASGASAKAPDAVPSQKKGVVAVYVNDKAGRHVASATGIIIDRRGVVATSCFIIPKWLEVIENTLLMKTEDGTESPLEYLISQNCNNGIALIKVRGILFPVINIASGHKPKKGEAVTVITRAPPETTVLEGRIKTTGRDGSFQTTVPITPKRDGSPVLNRKGEVIGISTFLLGKGQKQLAVIPAKNVAKEFNRYKHLIKESPPSLFDTPRVPSQVPAVAPAPRLQREGKAVDAEGYFALGSSYEKTNMIQEAVEAYKEAIRNKPDYFDAYVNLGLLYYKLGRYDEAVEAYLNAMTIRPDDKSVYNKLGAAYIILGNYSMALDTFKQSLKMDPGNPETHFNLGIAFVITGNRNGAVEEYDALKNLDRERAAKLLDLIY
ncbi:MAG: tetratricopeptide repeat-containing serine protease family protein [Nitrospirae bacterium]|nr:tetratricopeptide repeat-containing serine protease family protein [Nitrospirota bacterium]MCL5422818.1 tetratricopeptide repeat-containing serine protease family protein [Nitrospirota bacterium]